MRRWERRFATTRSMDHRHKAMTRPLEARVSIPGDVRLLPVAREYGTPS